MIEVITNYFILLLLLQPIEEIYTCNNPNTIGDVPHFICNWEDKDFINYPNGKRILRPYRKKDNFIKAYYRRKHYEQKYLEKN